MKGMLFVWEFLLSHFRNKFPYRPRHHRLHVSIFFDELGCVHIEHPEHVMHHQDLPVAIDSGPYSDGGNLEAFGYLARQIHWYPLQHNGEGPGRLQS